jgi:vacuolar-type H+-ATPase subunit H
MEKDVLSQVIEAEKEIQKCLESEKVKVRDWIEAVKKESEAVYLAEEQKIKESLDHSLAESARQAETKAGEIADAAGKSAERLGHLHPEILQRIVEKRLAKILPG